MLKLLRRTSLEFDLGVLVGVLAALLVYVGALFAWACWIISQVGAS